MTFSVHQVEKIALCHINEFIFPAGNFFFFFLWDVHTGFECTENVILLFRMMPWKDSECTRAQFLSVLICVRLHVAQEALTAVTWKPHTNTNGSISSYLGPMDQLSITDGNLMAVYAFIPVVTCSLFVFFVFLVPLPVTCTENPQALCDQNKFKNRLVIQKQEGLISICVLLFWWMFGCFSTAVGEVSSPHTHAHAYKAKWREQVWQVSSIRLEPNTKCLFRSCLHHHHPVHANLLEIPASPCSSHRLPLCFLIGKLLNNRMFKNTKVCGQWK